MSKVIVVSIILFITSCSTQTDRDYCFDEQIILYKYDSLDIITKGINESELEFDKTVFKLSSGKLHLINPDEIIERNYKIFFYGKERCIKVVDWRENVYKLEKQSYDGKYPLLDCNDSLFL